jgi:hypothetical protein
MPLKAVFIPQPVESQLMVKDKKDPQTDAKTPQGSTVQHVTAEERTRMVNEKPPEGLVEFIPDGAFTLTEEMTKYISYKETCGVVQVPLDTESAQRFFITEFNQWIRNGRPRPKMPEVNVESDPVPHNLYRLRVRGIQKIYYVDSKGKYRWKDRIEIPIHTGMEWSTR